MRNENKKVIDKKSEIKKIRNRRVKIICYVRVYGKKMDTIVYLFCHIVYLIICISKNTIESVLS